MASGFDLVADRNGLDDALRHSDLALTGEGKLDASSLSGKVVGGVVRRAAALGVRTVAVVGTADLPRQGLPFEVVSLTEAFGEAAALRDTVACVERAVLAVLGPSAG